MSTEDESNIFAWQKVQTNPRSIKRKNENSPTLVRKVPTIDHGPSTSSHVNYFAMLAEKEDVNNRTLANPTTDDEMKSDTLASEKPPPIFISDVNDINGLLRYLNLHMECTEFTYKSQRDGQTRIMVKNVEKFRDLVKILNTDQVKYHTFQLKQERAFRVVAKNIHHSTQIETIKKSIEMQGHAVRGIHNIKSRITKEPLPMFFIDLEPHKNNSEIYNIKHINNAIITIEPPKKVSDMVQCYRCQEFGHTKSYCNKKHKCVKCAENHSSLSCPKEKTEPATCANCHGNHAASYKGCRIYQEISKNRSNIPNSRPALTSLYDRPRATSFIPTKPNHENIYANQANYAQVVRGETAQEKSSLDRIEQLLIKQSELTTNLLNMIMMLVNRLCK